MILRIWYLGDAPSRCVGFPYLHGEVEDWISRYAPLHVDPQKREAPDLAVTDAAGVTIFAAAFGLDQLATVDVQGMNLLGCYPGELAFCGFAKRLLIAEALLKDFDELEAFEKEIRRPIFTNNTSVWQMPYEELTLRGLVVDKTRQEHIMNYVESKCKFENGKIKDIAL